jgi:peptidase E
LGFLSGSCCPHYDGDFKRRPTYQELIQSKQISSGIAIDDHVAVHYVNERIEKVVRASDSGSAYCLFDDNGIVIEEKIHNNL